MCLITGLQSRDANVLRYHVFASLLFKSDTHLHPTWLLLLVTMSKCRKSVGTLELTEMRVYLSVSYLNELVDVYPPNNVFEQLTIHALNQTTKSSNHIGIHSLGMSSSERKHVSMSLCLGH